MSNKKGGKGGGGGGGKGGVQDGWTTPLNPCYTVDSQLQGKKSSEMVWENSTIAHHRVVCWIKQCMH